MKLAASWRLFMRWLRRCLFTATLVPAAASTAASVSLPIDRLDEIRHRLLAHESLARPAAQGPREDALRLAQWFNWPNWGNWNNWNNWRNWANWGNWPNF